MSTQEFNAIIAKVFRYGIITVGILLAVGWVSQLQWTENIFTSYQSYQEKPLQITLDSAYEQEKWGLLLSYLGLAILICLPVVRVMISSILFAKRKEYRMMLLSLLVFTGLILSLVLGAIK